MKALLRDLGPVLIHVTAAANLPLIETQGLLPAATLARYANQDPATIRLRTDRLTLHTAFGTCTLNHQRPIQQAGDAPERMLDRHDRHSWAAQLDHRVFLSPKRCHAAFTASIARDLDLAEVQVSTEGLITALPDLVDLAPINTGNFKQGGANARRGDWIYVPLTAGHDAFRDNRRRRGLVKTRDRVREVSLRGPLPPNILQRIRITP